MVRMKTKARAREVPVYRQKKATARKGLETPPITKARTSVSVVRVMAGPAS